MGIKNVIPIEILTMIRFKNWDIAFVVIALASRPNKRRLCKPSAIWTFS
jgi:hypothetical protein